MSTVKAEIIFQDGNNIAEERPENMEVGFYRNMTLISRGNSIDLTNSDYIDLDTGKYTIIWDLTLEQGQNDISPDDSIECEVWFNDNTSYNQNSDPNCKYKLIGYNFRDLSEDEREIEVTYDYVVSITFGYCPENYFIKTKVKVQWDDNNINVSNKNYNFKLYDEELNVTFGDNFITLPSDNSWVIDLEDFPRYYNDNNEYTINYGKEINYKLKFYEKNDNNEWIELTQENALYIEGYDSSIEYILTKPEDDSSDWEWIDSNNYYYRQDIVIKNKINLGQAWVNKILYTDIAKNDNTVNEMYLGSTFDKIYYSEQNNYSLLDFTKRINKFFNQPMFMIYSANEPANEFVKEWYKITKDNEDNAGTDNQEGESIPEP